MTQTNTGTPVTMVTMTQLRRSLAQLADLAAEGQIVVITKSGIPFLQLIPVKHQFQPPLADPPINMGELATAEIDELVTMLGQARKQGNETLALAILAEIGERTAKKHMATAMMHLQEE